MYKHIFGPVPSRRLGISLGIDLVPLKTCTLNCVYCECGATNNLTLERKEYIPIDEVIEELRKYLGSYPPPDYITFSGSGEPLLNSKIGVLTDFIKNNYSEIPLAVLTNGALLNDAQVRKKILRADLVIPSLDAASDKTFRKINRPCHSIKIKEYIAGLVNFRKEFSGDIWLEVFILPGYNDNEEELKLMKEAIEIIRPDLIQLNSMDRPGVIHGLKKATNEYLRQVINFWDFDNAEIIAAPRDRERTQSYRKDKESAILETIARRPLTVEDISVILNLHINEINKNIGILESKGKIASEEMQGRIFYSIKGISE